jgi:hypothetical protein
MSNLKPKTPKQIAATLRATKAPEKRAILYHLLLTNLQTGTNVLPLIHHNR